MPKVFLHSKPKTLQIFWPLRVSVSPTTFIKSNIFPEAISFNFAEQEDSVESPQEKHYFTTKRGHFCFQSGIKQSFNTIFSRLRSFVPKQMPVQQGSAFQLHNVNPCKWIDVLHQKEHWTDMCGCCSCEIHFSFNKWEGGLACWLFGTVAMQLSWEFGTGLFRLDLFAVFTFWEIHMASNSLVPFSMLS